MMTIKIWKYLQDDDKITYRNINKMMMMMMMTKIWKYQQNDDDKKYGNISIG